MDVSIAMPLIWAQASNSFSAGPVPGTPPSQAVVLASLAIRRWCGSLTLSRPDPSTEAISAGLWAWLIGLGALLLIVIVAQGPARAIGQLLDVPGHARLLSAALGRFRRSGRLLAVTVGATVVAWTASQTLSYGVASGRDDQLALIKGQRLVDVGLNQGYLAALTPTRDILALAMNIPLLIAAAVALFQFTTDRWGSGVRPPISIRRRSSRWATIGWGFAAMYAFYRSLCLVTGNAELPIGGFVILEVAVLPVLMALADGVVVAWVLVELRNAGLGDAERDSFDVVGVTLLIPSTALACVLAFPSRYVGTAAWLALINLPTGSAVPTWAGSYFRWQLGWGLVDLQAAAVVTGGIFGAVAWNRGRLVDALKGYFRLLSAEGGHLVAALAAGGLAAGVVTTLAYVVVLSLPASTWALNAADSYAHYATLPVGLILAAATIELGERSLPAASLAGSAVEEIAA